MRLLKIGTEKQRISWLQNAAHFRQKLDSGGAIEVPDRAAQEKHAQVLAGLAVGGHFEQAIEIFALKTDDADGVDVAEFPLTHG